MALTLHFHPLASYCHKVLIALYENETPFARQIVDLGDEDSRAAFLQLSPVGKMPVLRDDTCSQTIPETSIIIEYLDQHYPGARALLPAARDLRLEARLWDRFFDLYVHSSMQKFVTDRLRADGERDPRGLAEAKLTMSTAYDVLEKYLTGKRWVVGESFTLADCSAAPALFYAAIVMPFPGTHNHLAAYFERLMGRASVKRVIDEARPYFQFFPFKDAMPARFLTGLG